MDIRRQRRKEAINTSYLIDKFKGKYRLLVEYNRNTNDFNRKLNDTYEDCDIYISCQHGNKVFYYGNSILEAYIPSLQRGNNILKAIKQINPNIILYTQKGDSEVIFRFKYSDSDQVIPLLKPRTSGASISPFSSKNLPKSNYTIPESDLTEYKSVISDVPKNELLSICHTSNNFIKTLITKQNPIENIKADMKLKGLKGKEYIHSIGQWGNYINYLRKELSK